MLNKYLVMYFLLTIDKPIITHTELIEANNLREEEVIKLIYNPDYFSSINKDIGIQYVDISFSRYNPPIPFKLKKNHLDAIEKFVNSNEEICKVYWDKIDIMEDKI
jgi:hypothetical protein